MDVSAVHRGRDRVGRRIGPVASRYEDMTVLEQCLGARIVRLGQRPAALEAVELRVPERDLAAAEDEHPAIRQRQSGPCPSQVPRRALGGREATAFGWHRGRRRRTDDGGGDQRHEQPRSGQQWPVSAEQGARCQDRVGGPARPGRLRRPRRFRHGSLEPTRRDAGVGHPGEVVLQSGGETEIVVHADTASDND